MRIAALSDMHSNVFAVEAVIADALERGADKLLNLGDILYGPIEPRATYELLMEHEFVTVRGNQDREIVHATADDLQNNPTLQYVHDDLGDEPIAWMSELPFDHHLNESVYLCHGTPTNDQIYLLEDVADGAAKVRSSAQIAELLGDIDKTIVICGHSHVPRTVQLGPRQVIVNPGSVGLPAYREQDPVPHVMENFSPLANYAMIDLPHDGSDVGITIQHYQVAYDYRRAAKAAAKCHRTDWVHALSSGRAL